MTGFLETLLVCAALCSLFPTGFKYVTYVFLGLCASYFVVGFPLVWLLHVDLVPSFAIVTAVGFVGGCAWARCA